TPSATPSVTPPPVMPDFMATMASSVTSPVAPESETLASLDFTAQKSVTEKEKVSEKPKFNLFGKTSVSTTPQVTPPATPSGIPDFNTSTIPQVTPPATPSGIPVSPISPPETLRKYAPMTVKGKGLTVRTKNGKGTKSKKNRLALQLLFAAIIGGSVAVFLQMSGFLESKITQLVNQPDTDIAFNADASTNPSGTSLGNGVGNPSGSPLGTENGNSVQNQAVNQAEPTQTPDFASIRLNLEQMKLREAQALVDSAREMNMTPEDKAHLQRLSDAVTLVTEFVEGVKRDLERYEPPMELCQGEFGLVESSPERVVIRIGGQNVHFSMKDPIKGGNNLYEIMYRHHALKAIPVGNLKPTLEYSAFLLVSPYGDRQATRQKVVELLKLVEEKGSPANREMAQGLKAEFQL
ncbi:MAG: hypothetical protein Q4C70_02000, partial [Planctomycetia bacterium]|nr:hypothetical protein [Planctomycetia bacterium]